jgi:hypothetical protein
LEFYLGPFERVGLDTIEFSVATGDAGGMAVVPISYSAPLGQDIQGFTFSICYDPAALTLMNVEPLDILLPVPGPAQPDFFAYTADGMGALTIALIADIDLETPLKCYPGLGILWGLDANGDSTVPGDPIPLSVAEMTFRLDGTLELGDQVDVAFCDGGMATGVPANNMATIANCTVAPILHDGAIVVTGIASCPFIRGDANQDGMVDLSDSIGILSYLFGLPPADVCVLCPDACDANDGGDVDIADAIAVLDYLFGGGSEPPPPFPVAGDDPTADALRCICADPICP